MAAADRSRQCREAQGLRRHHHRRIDGRAHRSDRSAAAMPQRILFLTGHLAAGRLRKVLAEMTGIDFAWETRDIGIQVAALMTAELIRRRLPREAIAADRIVVPGHCAGDLAALSEAL